MELLERLYYDPEQGFCGELKLYKRAHALDSTIKHKDVKQFLAKQELSQVFAPKMRLLSYPIYSAVPNSYQASYQADLTNDMTCQFVTYKPRHGKQFQIRY